MAYVPRALESKIRHLASGPFSAVLVTGPRQSGKSTLLTHVGRDLFGPALQVVAFDTPSEIDSFRRDPELFLANRPGPMLLDEVQHVPDIFPWLKREADRRPGELRFLLSGSQVFPLMKGVSESLAGRVAVLDLWPFAAQETVAADVPAFLALLEDPAGLEALAGREWPANDLDTVAPVMLAGGYPPVLLMGGGGDWLEGYRRTYLQRDVRDLRQVADLGRFDRFLMLIAGRTATVVNKAEVGRSLGLDDKTIEQWVSVLETSYQAFSLPPFERNPTKRLVRRLKRVFADIGLALHLQAIRTPEALLAAPHFGALFESFVLAEIRKLYGHAGVPFPGTFWRTADGRECDLVLEAGGRPTAIEVKHAASLSARATEGLAAFLDLHPEARDGVLISMHPRVERLSRRVWNLPLGLLLRGIG